MTDHQTWLGRLERAEGNMQRQKSIWERSIQLYDCSFFEKYYGSLDPERVDVHFVNWYITNVVNLTYFRDPFIFIKCEHSKYDKFADTMETVVNHHWKQLKMKGQMKKTILSGLLTSPGWIKIGYTANIGDDVAKIEEIKQKGIIDDIKSFLKGKTEKEDVTPEEQGIMSMDIKEESIFGSWVSSWNMLMPAGYNQIKDMPWIAEVEWLPMIDFKRNPFYKNKGTAKGSRDVSEVDSGSSVMHKPSYNREPTTADDETQMIKLFHVWDRRDQQRHTFSYQDEHFRGDWPYDMEGFPYKPLVFEETLPTIDQSNAYPTNAVTPILPQVMEISNARTMQVKHRRRCNVVVCVPKGVMTESEINKIEENGAVDIVEVPGGAQSLQGFQVPPLTPDVWQVDSKVMQDLQMATNMGQMMFAPQPGQRTATQATMGAQGMQLKAQSRVDCVEYFTVDIAQGMAQLAWQFYDRDKVSEIIGEEATEEMWPDLPGDRKERRRIIQSELEFKVDAGSAAPPKDETVDKKQLLDFLNFAAQFAPERIKKGEALKAGMKRWKFVKDIDSIIIGNDDEEQKKAEAEDQLMLQHSPALVGPNENYMIHIAVHKKNGQNPMVAQHIMAHGGFLGIHPNTKGGKGKPQKGDLKPPRIAQNPEMSRQGAPSSAGVNSSIQNKGLGTGKESM